MVFLARHPPPPPRPGRPCAGHPRRAGPKEVPARARPCRRGTAWVAGTSPATTAERDGTKAWADVGSAGCCSWLGTRLRPPSWPALCRPSPARTTERDGTDKPGRMWGALDVVLGSAPAADPVLAGLVPATHAVPGRRRSRHGRARPVAEAVAGRRGWPGQARPGRRRGTGPKPREDDWRALDGVLGSAPASAPRPGRPCAGHPRRAGPKEVPARERPSRRRSRRGTAWVAGTSPARTTERDGTEAWEDVGSAGCCSWLGTCRRRRPGRDEPGQDGEGACAMLVTCCSLGS